MYHELCICMHVYASVKKDSCENLFSYNIIFGLYDYIIIMCMHVYNSITKMYTLINTTIIK